MKECENRKKKKKGFLLHYCFSVTSVECAQVHRAVTKEGKEVAMKVQYPGVANSINSDIDNVKTLLYYTNLIPEGLYLEQAMKVSLRERESCLNLY